MKYSIDPIREIQHSTFVYKVRQMPVYIDADTRAWEAYVSDGKLKFKPIGLILKDRHGTLRTFN